MDIQLLAGFLLVGRLVSEVFMVLVIIRQWKISKLRTHPTILKLRRALSLLAIIVFVGNLYPLFLDLYTLFNPAIRTSPVVNLAGAIYSVDNNLTFLFASILIWTLYKLSDVVIEQSELFASSKKDK